MFSDAQRVYSAVPVKLGYAMPAAPISPTRPGWRFDGWFTERNGGGTKYYNGDGSVALSLNEYAVVGNLTLYGAWTLVDASLAGTISINGVWLSGGVSQTGDGWSYDGSTGFVQLTEMSKTYVVTGNDTAGEFGLIAQTFCTVVMSNLTINASANVAIDASANVARPPYQVADGNTALLGFKGVNRLYGPANYPAIHVGMNSTLYLPEYYGDEGKVYATGGADAPGIGGAVGQTSGTLYINGGTIEATGGSYGSGIGAARGSGFGTVEINAGIVTATGKNYGSGIGGSYRSGTGTYVINGGTIKASGGSYGGAGIGSGGGVTSAGGTVKITGGTVTATGGYLGGAGIGAGESATGVSVAISGGNIKATGGKAWGEKVIWIDQPMFTA